MMKSRSIRITLSLLLAAVVTGGAYYTDVKFVENHSRNSGLRFARQIASQAEAMALTARTQGQKDPLGWAVDYLAQGGEPRVMRISKLNSEDEKGAPELGENETFRYESSTGIFDYTKTVELLGGGAAGGVRIQVDLGFAGFLGARSSLSNDLYLAIFFFFWSAFAAMGFAYRAPREKEVSDTMADPLAPLATVPERVVEAAPAPIVEIHSTPAAKARSSRSKEAKLRASVLVWVGDARASLTSLGVGVRDVLKQGQMMSQAARNSLSATEALREKIHGGLRDLHSSRQTLRASNELLSQIELLANAPATEESRKELGQLAARLKQSVAQGDQAIKNIEVQVEPWATDADLSYEAHAAVLQATQGMSGCIEGAKDQLVAQARLLNELHAQLSSETAAPAKVTVEAVEKTA